VVSLSQDRTAAAQCGLFTHKSVPVIFEPPCIFTNETYYRIILTETITTLMLKDMNEKYTVVTQITVPVV